MDYFIIEDIFVSDGVFEFKKLDIKSNFIDMNGHLLG
jgi:hypothetical protein